MTDQSIEEFLLLFEEDTQLALSRRPHKTDAGGPAEREVAPPLSTTHVESREFVTLRDSYRKRLRGEIDGQLIRLEQVLPGRAAASRDDRAEDLVDPIPQGLIRTLEEMERRDLTRAELAESPWSDFYWPIYQGEISARYADPSFPADKDFRKNRAYVKSNPAAAIVSAGSARAIELLSPAEKYDLLVGDPVFTLSESMWQDGERYYRASGAVETWMGNCHGWAPASYMTPRPRKSITVPAADGRTSLTFFPSDIKALATVLWAKVNPPTRFIGCRCDDKDPPRDEIGRVRSDRCFDTNPGTWHLAVINQIGVAKRSLVLDATFDYEVWNQPLFGYRYSYFNPRTRKPTPLLRDAIVRRSEFPGDKFARYRSPNSHSLVGIAMSVTYVIETRPDHSPTDSPKEDLLRTVDYLYDLELDERGNILGGEWYTNLHPDFLWTPAPRTEPLTALEDAAAGAWAAGPVPAAWQQAARSAARHQLPLYKIVAALVERAR